MSVLDALTADNPTVLVSFGGRPNVKKEVEEIGGGCVEDAERGNRVKVESEDSRSRGSAAYQHVANINR